MIEKEIKILARFLKTHNIYDRYFYYVNHPERYSKGTTREHCATTKNYLKYVDISRAINCAFYWVATKEGDCFWRDIYNKYQNFLKENGNI